MSFSWECVIIWVLLQTDILTKLSLSELNWIGNAINNYNNILHSVIFFPAATPTSQFAKLKLRSNLHNLWTGKAYTFSRWSFPPDVRVQMRKCLVKRKHCLSPSFLSESEPRRTLLSTPRSLLDGSWMREPVYGEEED